MDCRKSEVKKRESKPPSSRIKRKPVSAKNSEFRDEYRFDYKKSSPNRFADRVAKDCQAVVLEPDVAKAFPNAAEVNNALRAVIKFKKSLNRPV